jgi:sugar/nucleoside kinase (ribokinase family)
MKAIQCEMASGAFSVTKQGAQPSMPECKDLLKLLKK